jgi:hypothetical protein
VWKPPRRGGCSSSRLAASDFGVPSVVIAPWFALAAASAAALAAAAVIAAGPALLATRLHPAALLRSE